MTCPPEPSASLLQAFAVHQPVFVTRTTLATVWKVTREDGQPAALKCYHDPAIPDERPGFDLLDAWQGEGAARLDGLHHGAALLEWLEGPTLGDLAREGQLEQADGRLAATAARLHTEPVRVNKDMRHLADWCRALREPLPATDTPDETRHNINRARALADTLIAGQRDIRPLHGDLHHDNIICSPRGDLAFDAKGIVGDRAYELATAFLNPVGGPHIIKSPDYIRRRSAKWGQELGVSPERLLDWAAVHAALSAVWHLRDGGTPNFAMLNVLWAVRDASE
ncbi:aminoglycoside phosphotransferase family protein [Cognatiyoonia sp. IB215446]|uniref:aminoglycoside phosphotransferase family protein n=1 Tax=Cognatiyoonia sp. IB215446 TaxID=3097355 RepID=UPI002A11FFC4|nr:aminoglycoside phosphotransferase family protein [Cognatiyoonia sp. IB215446]MDX8347748.1 aminoglycoside phosphotransferase family protein [Cognatiyoonia sp. IB215446]